MHVVDPDVGGEPAEHAREFVMRAAVERGLMQIPVLGTRPVRLLELMLHVEQPNARRRREEHDGDMDQQERNGSDKPDQHAGGARNGEICRHRAQPRRAFAHEAER